MIKTFSFNSRKNKNTTKGGFNRKQFINDFKEVVVNECLTKEQKVEILTDHCLYDKNSPFKLYNG